MSRPAEGGRPDVLTTTSADGTPIAYEVHGATGPPVVLVAGIFCTRATLRPLAEALAAAMRVAVYDRRGRGDSGGVGEPAPADPAVAVAREVADLAAVIGALGGPAAVYGHSSGAGVALQAVAAGAPITRLVLHEPPYGEAADATEVRAMAADVVTALDEDRPGDAITRFLADVGMPDAVLAATATDPAMVAVAPTMPYDLAVMGDLDAGGVLPEALAAAVAVPTLVVLGGASPPFFRATAERLAALVPGAELVVLDGQDHGAPAEAVAPAVGEFLSKGFLSPRA